MDEPADSPAVGMMPHPPRERGVFCNRTLNLRAIGAIGYDMDYTLIHYQVERWERRAYWHLKRKLAARQWPVDQLDFDPRMMVRGLVLDLELGNIVKSNRFGYVKQACHGTRALDYQEQRRVYARTFVELDNERFVFVNTLFSLSEVCMYGQLVDLLDEGRIPGVLGYRDLYREVRRSLDEAHMEGKLKAEIVDAPEQYVELDPELPSTLLDQKRAGKRLLLITNSGWPYARAMMSYAFDRFLPGEMIWRDLFDLVIVAARKPGFFSTRDPLFEVVDDEGLLRPAVGPLTEGGVYFGGHAAAVEQHLGLAGDQILYVGDHIYADVHVSKSVLRWRTALIVRELEQELAALQQFEEQQVKLSQRMARKEQLEFQLCQLRLAQERMRHGDAGHVGLSAEELHQQLQRMRQALVRLDAQIAPLAKAAGQISNPRWGLLMRAGNDKSHLARQIERHADIYTSRVSNFLMQTPYVYLRSPRGTLPHDPGPAFDDVDADAPGDLETGTPVD